MIESYSRRNLVEGELIVSARSDDDSFVRNYFYHLRMVSGTISEFIDPLPLLYVRCAPESKFAGSSSSKPRTAISAKYNDISKHLIELKQGGDSHLEPAAIDTALQIVTQLRQQELPPPRVSLAGEDSVLFLWALGSSKLALSITEGEVGYVVRKSNETVDRKSNLSASNFDIRSISPK